MVPMGDLAGALAGVRVIEVASYIPGPLCAQILADWGAEVVKVERPGGDPMRTMEPRPAGGESPLYPVYNRGKASVELDLKSPEGVTVLRDLAAGADVLIDGFRPGVLERLGVGPEALRALNPRLIYCAISGFGADVAGGGPAGHDMNFVALAGLLALNPPGAPPSLPGAQLADSRSGLMAATGILAALRQRDATGSGATLDLAMSDAARWLAAPWLAAHRAGLVAWDGGGHPLGGGMACYTLYATADGRRLAVAALEAHFWRRFCEAIGRPDLAGRQHDADQAGVTAEVAAAVGAHPLAHWAAVFAEVDACVTPVLGLDEAEGLPQHRRRGFDFELPVRGRA